MGTRWGDRIVIVDFSFPAAPLEDWAGRGAEVTVIDHHKTAMEYLSGLSDRVLRRFDMSECGATLAWRTFFANEEMPVFLEYVRDRDLWQFKLPGTHEVHEAMSRIGRTFAMFDRLAQMNRAELLAYLHPIGEVILAEKRKKVKAIAERAVLGEVAGHQDIPYVILSKSEDRYTSDVCWEMYLTCSLTLPLSLASPATRPGPFEAMARSRIALMLDH